MLKTACYSLYFIAIAQVILAIAFFLQLPFAVNLWPFEGTTPLTFIFLAYEVVLLGPFLTRLPTVAAENRLDLIVYTTVLILSGLLAIYFLFVHRHTRLATWRRSKSA